MRFIVTKELGKLAKRLRILGFDTIECESAKPQELIIRALSDERIIVTRSKAVFDKLEKSTIVIISADINEQLRMLFEKLHLKVEEEKMFTRCTLCNSLLSIADKSEIKNLVPPRVYEAQEIFRKCPSCGKIYWQGTHWGKLKEKIKGLQ